MSSARWLAIAAGAGAGAACRWAVLTSTAVPSGFPWPVFGVNVFGSLLLGAVLAQESRRPGARLVLHDFAAIGFCGGLTTFSTFAVEVADLIRLGRTELAIAYAVASVACSLMAVAAGAALFHRVRAVTLPLEEAP